MLRTILFCVFSGILGEIGAELSDMRRCADPECKTILSIGRTLIHYNGQEPGMLSFSPNSEVKIFSKEAGNNPDLWGVVINGRRGYANKKHIQEQRVIHPNKDISQVVPIEPFFKPPPHMQQQGPNPTGVNQGPLSPSSPQLPPPVPNTHLPHQAGKTHLPSTAQKTRLPGSPPAPSKANNFEVIDGTTLYLDPGMPAINESPPNENITPSEIQPTVTGQQAAGSPTASAGSAMSGNDGIEPSVPGDTPEIESSVRSPSFQDLEETPRSNTEPVVTGNTVGGPAPTQPEGGGQHAPLDATDPATGEVVKDMPRTATPPDLKQQPSEDQQKDSAGGVSGSDGQQPQVITRSESPAEGGIETPQKASIVPGEQPSKGQAPTDLPPQVNKNEQPKQPAVDSATEEPFIDDGSDDEDEEEVADYDNYDDYDDDFHATLNDLNDILDKGSDTDVKSEVNTNQESVESQNEVKSESVVDNVPEEKLDNENVISEQSVVGNAESIHEKIEPTEAPQIDNAGEIPDPSEHTSEPVTVTNPPETVKDEEIEENPVENLSVNEDIVTPSPELQTDESAGNQQEIESASTAQQEATTPEPAELTHDDAVDVEPVVVTEANVVDAVTENIAVADEVASEASTVAALEEPVEGASTVAAPDEPVEEAESAGIFSGWFGSEDNSAAEEVASPEMDSTQNPSESENSQETLESVTDSPPEVPVPEEVPIPEQVPTSSQEQPVPASTHETFSPEYSLPTGDINNQMPSQQSHFEPAEAQQAFDQAEASSFVAESSDYPGQADHAHDTSFNHFNIGEESFTQDSVPEELSQSGFDSSSYPVPENPYKDGQPDLNIDALAQPALDDVAVTTETSENVVNDFDQIKQSADAFAQSADEYSQAGVNDPYSQGHLADQYQQSADQYQQSVDQYQQSTEQYEQTADSYQQTADQYQQTADPYQQTADSYQQTADPYQQTADSYQQTADPYQQTADQYQQTADPYQQSADSYQQPTMDPYNQAQYTEPGSHSHTDTPVTGYLMSYMPDWLHEAAHQAGGINGDRAVLLVVVAATLVLVNIINSCISRGSREKPLLAKVAELDRKLFQSSNELLLLKKEASERGSTSEDTVSATQVRELEIQLEQANLEKDRLENHSREIQTRCSQFQEEIYRAVAIQQEKEKEAEVAAQEKEAALEEARQAQEMVEEMINSQNNNQPDVKLIELVQKLQKQLESQQDVLKQYEPKLKKKEKEAKELSKELKQLRADKANAELSRDKMEKQVEEINQVMHEKSKLLEDKTKNEEEWQSLSDLLQKQLDEKSEESAKLEEETSSLKSRLNIFQNELDDKEEQLEVLQETINQLNKNKGKKQDTPSDEGGDGWDVEEEGDGGWDVGEDIEVEEGETEDVGDVTELAKLKVAARRASSAAKKLTDEVEEIKKNLSDTKTQLEEREEECERLRTARDETVTDLVETNRKLEVLEQFFNKKEAELQKQLGLQSARFGDVSSSADTTAKQLASVNEELDTTKSAMKVLKCELEEQEKSLKAAVAVQEKKAHENWVAARQAERKLNDLQTEISTLRNRLTVTESKAQTLEQEKHDLQTTIQAIQQGKPEGVNGTGSTTGPPEQTGSETGSVSADPASLPPLPGLPSSSLPPLPGLGMPALPAMMVPPSLFPPLIDTRPPTLGRISPPRDRERSDNSFRSGGGRDYSPVRGGRDYSPTSRSERRGGGRRVGSPPMRRPSPTRSDRGYYRDRDSSTDRSYRHDDRYDRRSARDDDYDRYYDNPPRRGGRNDGDYDRRGSRDYADTSRSDDYYDGGRRGRDYLDLKPGGPKTSSPLEPPQSRKFVA